MPTRIGAAVINRVPYGSSLLPSALLTRLIRHPRRRGLALGLMLGWYGATDSEIRHFVRWLKNSGWSKALVFNGQMLQDAWVLSRRDSQIEGFFVDVGAAYPVKYSNSYLLQQMGWNGILIDANPRLAHELRLQRESDSVRVVEAAVSDGKGTETLLCAGPMSSLESSVNVDHLGKKRKRISTSEGRFEVTTATLDDLLKSAGAPETIDYLSIDVEGHDLTALRSIDLTQWDVRAISVEHNFQLEQLSAMDDHLRQHDFVRVCGRWSSIDSWYVKREDLMRRT